MNLSGAVPDVAVGRIAEQGALFMSALVLAAESTPADFAIAALLYAIASAGSALADVGVGLQILRLPGPGLPVALLRAVAVSGLLAVAVGVFGLFVGGGRGTVLAFGAAIWVLSAVVQLSRAVALCARQEHLVLRSSLGGACALLGGVLLLPFASASMVAGAALVAKLGIEALALGRIPLSESDAEHSWYVVGNQVLNYAGANLDYLLVGIVLGPAAFAVYTMAFRVSSGLNSIASFTIVRLATVRLTEQVGSDRSAYLRRLIGPVFVLGALGTAATYVAAPLLASVVGSGWTDLVIVVQILSFMMPFRLVHGLLGAAFLVEHADSTLLRVEVLRVISSLMLLSLAASRGLVEVSAMALALSIVSVGGTALVLQRRTTFQLVRSQPVAERSIERTT